MRKFFTLLVFSVFFLTLGCGSNDDSGKKDLIALSSEITDGTWNIYLLDVATGLAEQITDNGSYHSNPEFSPDAEELVFITDFSIKDPQTDEDFGVFEPDATIFRESSVNRILKYNLDTKEGEFLTNTGSSHQPSWSPDGSKILFNNDRTRDVEIFVMNSDGSNKIQLTDSKGEDWFPEFSPNGEKIAFQSARTGNWEIYVMDADGSNVIQLTDEKTSLSWEPVWSPEGNRIAFTSDRNGAWDIYVMDSDGSNVLQLTQNDKADVAPVWSPEGDKIAFASSRSKLGFFEIFIVDVKDKKNIEGPIMRGLPASWIKK